MFKKLPPLNSLLAFEASARLNSFKKAADELHQTPAAIAYQVKKLEESLNLALFTRQHKGVELNTNGETYYQTVKSLLTNLQNGTQEIQRTQQCASLNILTLHAIAEKWLMPRLADFRKHYPNIRIQINASENLNHSTKEDIVIGFSLQNPVRTNAIIFMEEEIFPVCSPVFLEKADHGISLDNLSNIEILIDSHWKNDWDAWLKINNSALEVKKTHSLSFSLYSMVVDAAVKGMGLAMGHKQLIQHELEKGLLIMPFEGFTNLKGFYYFSVDENLKQAPQIKSFLEWL